MARQNAIYKLNFLHSDYGESSNYLQSPTGKRLWLLGAQEGEERREFLRELNSLLATVRKAELAPLRTSHDALVEEVRNYQSGKTTSKQLFTRVAAAEKIGEKR